LVSREGFSEDGERSWMELREITNLGNEKMSNNTCSAAAGYGARPSGVKNRRGREHRESTWKEQRERSLRRVRLSNREASPLSFSFIFFKPRKAKKSH